MIGLVDSIIIYLFMHTHSRMWEKTWNSTIKKEQTNTKSYDWLSLTDRSANMTPTLHTLHVNILDAQWQLWLWHIRYIGFRWSHVSHDVCNCLLKWQLLNKTCRLIVETKPKKKKPNLHCQLAGDFNLFWLFHISV